MLNVAAVLFAIAALGGLTMAYIHFRHKRNPPGVLAALHGMFAATALFALIWGVAQTDASAYVLWALGLFVLAAFGGFLLFSFDVRNRRLPSAVVLIHALVAITAFLLLLIGIQIL